MNKEVFIAKISKLPSGKAVLSSKPSLAISETELREELKLKYPFSVVEDLIYRFRRR
jgi:hypothetical protein